MKIGNVEIGRNKPCKIIAELGTLHLHDKENMECVVQDCFISGADIVKTQLINPKTAWWATEEQKKRYRKLEWTIGEWHEFFKRCNKKKSKPVFASVFDDIYIRELNDVVPAWKIGNKAINDEEGHQIVKNCVDSGMNVMVSIAEKNGKPHDPLGYLRHTPENVFLFYVQPFYPVLDKEVRLPVFGGMYHGLSIHTKNMNVLKAAMVLGAQAIEVHVQGYDAQGPDTTFALNMDELSELVHIRNKIYSKTSH